MQVKIKKLKPEAHLPSYVHPGDAGMDLYALEDYELKPGEQHIFMLGLALEFEHGYVGLMQDRGSMAKNSLHVVGGVYDAGYRGEYGVMLMNLSQQSYKVEAGHKIAQLVIYPVAVAEIEEVDELSASQRGDGRFGSTGR